MTVTATGTDLSAATRKQREVLVAVVMLGSIKAAAEKLGIKENAARHRLSTLYRRLAVDGIAQAAYLLGREHLD